MDAVAESGLEGVCGRGGLKISFGALPLWLETKSQTRMRVRGWDKRRRKQGSADCPECSETEASECNVVECWVP